MNDGVPTFDDLADPVVHAGNSESESAGELVDSSSRCEHYQGGAGYSDPLRLRYISRKYPEDYKQLEVSLQGLVGNQVSAINRQNFGPTRRYLSNIVLVRGNDHHRRIVRILRDEVEKHPGKFFIWTDEGDHIHVVHDCAYPGGQCRCRIMQHSDIRGSLQKPLRRIKHVSELDSTDWANVFLYFGVSKWPSCSQVWIGGRLQRSPDYDQSIRWKEMQRRSREILEREVEGAGHNNEQQERIGSNNGECLPQSSSGTGRKKRGLREESETVGGKKSKFARIAGSVQSLLSKHYCLPANHLKHILVHDEVNDFLYDPTVEKHYISACDLFTHIHNKYTLKDFYELYEKCVPTFYSNDIDPFNYYHNMEDSIHYVKQLLEFQCQNDLENIHYFLTNIRDWFNKFGWDGNVKMNTILIQGPPNCGKNYFFDMLSSIAYNVGHIGRVCNKTNNFPLQDCFNRRLCIANEMSVEESAIEDMKKLCEGTAFNIRVKYQGDKIFTKAPVVIITNEYIDFLHRPEFLGVRVHKIEWNTCDMLKYSDKKPYPLALFEIFKLYNISIE